MSSTSTEHPADRISHGTFSAESLRRIGLLIVSLIMVISLCASGIVGYSAARRDAAAVTEAQIVMLAMGAGRELRRVARTEPEEAAPLFDDLRDKGVTWISVVNRKGHETFSLGTPVRAFSIQGAPLFGQPSRFPMRVAFLEGGRLAHALIALPKGPPADSRSERPGGGEGPLLRVELVPHQAIVMMTRARRMLLMNLAAAALLLGVAGVFWRLSRRSEQERLESERVRRDLEYKLERDRQLKALGQMSAVLGHELRNPLAAMKGHAQLLLEKLPDDDGRRVQAETIAGETAHLAALTDQILEYARTGALSFARVYVDDLIDRVVQLSGLEKSVRIQFSPELPPCEMDRQRMERVLVNVLENAALAAPGGYIEISAAISGDRLELRVSDQGPGFDPLILDRVFEPFITGRAQGTGLGLALARRIVEDHGGTITAGNRPQGGAQIEILLPLKRSTGEATP